MAGGRVGLRLFPGLLEELSRDRSLVCVSGTNGKTTTTALIARGWGVPVVTNETGANMPAGHAAALAGSSAGFGVLEVDEAWLPEVMARLSPRVIVLLNLSRDQLDRASEVRTLAGKWRAALARSGASVVANANDPLVVYAAETAETVLWCDVPTPWLEDARSCPHCTRPLTHEGVGFSCVCGFSRPARISARLDGESAVIGATSVPVSLGLSGEFNRANATMALCALDTLGVDVSEAAARMSSLSSVAGRFDVRRYHGRSVRMLLAKNPAGFSALLSMVPSAPGEVWIAINARVADGRDPSWLYDVPFELLRGHRVVCFGDRRLDLATRLDYAGVEWRLAQDSATPEPSEDVVHLLANYTAFADWLKETEAC